MAGFGGTGLALMYLAVSAAGVKGLWDQVNRTKLVIAASAGILVSAGAIFGAIYKAASPLNSVPWALGIWIVLGAVWSIIAVRRSSDTTESGPKTDALAANPSGLG
jgi:F0F1-type ATP synthase assembly protein I